MSTEPFWATIERLHNWVQFITSDKPDRPAPYYPDSSFNCDERIRADWQVAFKALEEIAALRAKLEEVEAELASKKAVIDALRAKVESLTDASVLMPGELNSARAQVVELREALTKAFYALGNAIEKLSLNESAKAGIQTASKEAAVLLDKTAKDYAKLTVIDREELAKITAQRDRLLKAVEAHQKYGHNTANTELWQVAKEVRGEVGK